MARRWLRIRVELLSGMGMELEQPPGRVFAVAPSLTFARLAQEIDTAFGRWDLAHLHVFDLADGRQLGVPDDDPGEDAWLDDTAAKIGTELAPAGPSGKNTAFAGGSHLVQFQESKNKDLGAAFVDFMLEPAQLNKFTGEIGFLPGTTDGIKASGYLDDPQRKLLAEELLDHSAVYPPSREWGGLEGADIFDGTIQKVMKGQTTGQQAVQELAKKMDEEFAG